MGLRRIWGSKSESSSYVLQRWLGQIPWKMQTVLIQGLRAPDTHFCKNTKIVSRWMRSVVLRNADEDHTFMCTKDSLPSFVDLENELSYCSMHFATHFLYALEIITYKHPDSENQMVAHRYYFNLVEGIMHFGAESEEQLDLRLADVDREPVPKPCPVEEEDPYLRH